MPGFTNVVAVGHAGRDAEMKHLPSGAAICEFSLGCTDKANGKDSETIWFDVSFFGKTAEIAAEYVKKGRAVLVEGRLKQESWEDRNGGGKRSKVKIVGNRFQLLGDGGGGEARTQQPNAAKPAAEGLYSGQVDTVEEAPF